jgi:hypothetical protein
MNVGGKQVWHTWLHWYVRLWFVLYQWRLGWRLDCWYCVSCSIAYFWRFSFLLLFLTNDCVCFILAWCSVLLVQRKSQLIYWMQRPFSEISHCIALPGFSFLWKWQRVCGILCPMYLMEEPLPGGWFDQSWSPNKSKRFIEEMRKTNVHFGRFSPSRDETVRYTRGWNESLLPIPF